MANEASPFEEEKQIEDSLTEDLIELFALSLVYATDSIVYSQFTSNDFQTVQTRFRSRSSQSLSNLNSVSQESVDIAVTRTERETALKSLQVDLSDSRFSNNASEIFDQHMSFVLNTNQNMFNNLREIAFENGWSNEELARRLERYFGLTPNHMRTVINMEKALKAEGVKQQTIKSLVQKRIDQLIEWRLSLIAVQLSTDIVESSKDAAFSYLVSTGQVSIAEYEKQWVSVIDENTTQICTSSHMTKASIGSNFPNGRPHPPAHPPIHPCRSAIRLVKKVF